MQRNKGVWVKEYNRDLSSREKYRVAYELNGCSEERIPKLIKKYAVQLDSVKHKRVYVIAELIKENRWFM